MAESYPDVYAAWVTYKRTEEDGNAVNGRVLAVGEVLAGDEDGGLADRMRRAVDDLGWVTTGVERMTHFSDEIRAAEAFACAVAAIETGDIALGTAFESPDVPEEIDPDETRVFASARDAAEPVYVDTYDAQYLAFVLGFSDETLLVQSLDSDVVVLNGYTLFARDEVLKLVTLEEHSELEPGDEHFLRGALRFLEIEPRPLEAPIGSIAAFLRWAKDAYPLVGVWEDRRWERGRFIGEIRSVTKATLILRGVDRSGAWTAEHEHDIGEITRVDVDTGYLNALAKFVARS